MSDMQLGLVLEYRDPAWSQDMILAFRIGQIYIEAERKWFPEQSRAKYPKKGDPRKGELFRICWKLINETKDKLKPEELRYYIQAQLSILKNIKAGPAKELFYGPRCLLGEPAWNRWLVWKKFASSQKAKPETPKVEVNYKVDFIRTKAVLENKLRPLDAKNLLESMVSGQLFRLAMLKAVSPSFLQTCPLVREYVLKNPEISRLYEVKITEPPTLEAVRQYEELFGKNFK